MGNNLKSLVTAAGLLLSSNQSAPAQAPNTTVQNTRQAIITLINRLPADTYAMARKVLTEDLALLDDESISPADQAIIESHASKLITVARAESDRVIQALRPKKSAPPINESKEEKAARLAAEKLQENLDKIIADLNKGGIFAKEAWKSTDTKGAHCDIKISKTDNGNSIKTTFKPAGAKGVNAKSTAFFHIGLLPGRTYSFDIRNITGKGSFGMKMRDEKGQLTSLIPLQKGANQIIIPGGYSGQQDLEIVNSALEEELVVDGIKVVDLGPVIEKPIAGAQN